MTDSLSRASRRLGQAKDFIMGKTQIASDIPWDPDSTSFPLRKDLPKISGAPDDAAWVWGKDDYIGRLNLLTPTRVKAAAAEIRTEKKFQHKIKMLHEGFAYDDIYTMNTQSGTQWDGFRHVAHIATNTFYNNTKSSDFTGEGDDTLKCSIHHWSDHGFSGRAVLLDYRTYATSKSLKYDSATPHAISYDELAACGTYQNLDIRPASAGGSIQPGDILLIRSGWTEDYYARSPEENARLALRENGTWAGVEQSQAMITWLHDCYFSAVGGDAPSFERWPTPEKYLLHEYLLAMWGMPLGEMIDLEKAAQICRKNGRWTFFFTSAPARCVGGVSSHVNGTAIF